MSLLNVLMSKNKDIHQQKKVIDLSYSHMVKKNLFLTIYIISLMIFMMMCFLININ
jgi:hypothetical protein